MKAMILAAGRGERMRPLTDHTPKPLLPVGGRPLLDWHLEALADAGIRDIVINLAWLGDRIRAHVGDGSRWGVHVQYSDEGTQALETAGGILRALPLLGDRPFAVINADVWTDYPRARLSLPTGRDAHLILVDNPSHNAGGDFALQDGLARSAGTGRTLTFAGLGVYTPTLFADIPDGPAPLGPLLREAASADRVSAEHHRGRWYDIGTPERLAAIDRLLAADGKHNH